MKTEFPWGIVISSVAIAVILRPIFHDDMTYFLSCLFAAVLLGVFSAVLER